MPQQGRTPIRSFTDLKAWKEGYVLVLGVYAATCGFPREETYSLTDQMRRAATSVTSNIAEGFGRRTKKERIQFYYLAQGSLTELKNQMPIAIDVGYLQKVNLAHLAEQANVAHALLQGLLSTSKRTSEGTRNS